MERVLGACGPWNGGAGKGGTGESMSASCTPSGIECAHAFVSFLLSRLHDVEPDHATWQAAHTAFTHAFVDPPDTVQQKKLAKLLRRPLLKEVADALFKYEWFLHGLGRMNLSAVARWDSASEFGGEAQEEVLEKRGQ